MCFLALFHYSLQLLQGTVLLWSTHCSKWSNLFMPEALTTEEWVLAGAIPSQEFKKSHIHNRKQDPRPVLFSCFLWSLSSFLIHRWNLTYPIWVRPHLVCLRCPYRTKSNQKKNPKRKKHRRIFFLTRWCIPVGAASWCLTCCCVKTVSSVFHGEIMPSNSPQFPIQFAHFGSARGPAPFNSSHLTKWTLWKEEVHPLFLGFSLYCCCFMPPPLLWIGSAEK